MRPRQIVSQYLNDEIVPTGGSGGGAPSGPAGGDLTGTYPNPLLGNVVVAGTVGNSNNVGQVTYDAKGRVTAASNVAIAFPAPSGPAGGDLTGSYPNPTLGATAVTAGSYGDSRRIPNFDVDSTGRLTFVDQSVLFNLLEVTASAVTSNIGATVTEVVVSGVLPQVLVLPLATAVNTLLGNHVKVTNRSTGAVTVYADVLATQLVVSLATNEWALFSCIDKTADVAASWNVNLVTAATPVACVLGRNASASGAYFLAGDTIEWNVTISDTLGMYNGGTGGTAGTAAITIPVSGLYTVSFCFKASPPFSSIVGIQIWRDAELICETADNSSNNPVARTSTYAFAAGQVIQMRTASFLEYPALLSEFYSFSVIKV